MDCWIPDDKYKTTVTYYFSATMQLLLRFWIMTILYIHVRGETLDVGPYTLDFTSRQTETLSAANEKCTATHSWLVETKNKEINTAMAQLAGMHGTWIGLRYDTDSSTWKWNDLEEMDYSSWYSDEPNSLNKEQCAKANGGIWYSVRCGSDRYVACQSVTKPVMTSGVYLLTRSEISLTREEADQACADGNGWLVRMKDAELNVAVFDLIRTYGGGYWMDLKHDAASGTVSWTDGDALQKWEYNKLTTTKPSSTGKDCVVISPENGHWIWESCSTTHGYVCQSMPCASAPCKNGAACEATAISPYYACDDLCDPDPCGVGEVCTADGTTHTCNDHCNSNPCQNGGTCEASKTTSPYYICSCLPAYEGEQCQEPSAITSYVIHSITSITSTAATATTNSTLPMIVISSSVLALGVVLILVSIFVIRRRQNKANPVPERNAVPTYAEPYEPARSRNGAYESELEMRPGSYEQPGPHVYHTIPDPQYESIKETAFKEAFHYEL